MNPSYEPNPTELFAFLTDENVPGPETEDGESEAAIGKYVSETGRGAVMFCVDCAEIDWESGENLPLIFSTITKYMRNQIIASDGSEMTGLVLYNVGTTKNPLRQRGIYLVQDLSGLTARRIREVSELVSIPESDFGSCFGGSTNDTDISELIFVCNAQFRKVSAAYTPRIIIFTRNDEPCGTDRKAHQAAITRANDFLNAIPNSQIQLIPFGEPADFEVGKFWSEILRIDSESSVFHSEAVRFLSDIQSHTLKKLFKKRPVNRVNLYLSPNGGDPLALMIYTSFFPASKPRQLYVDPESKRPLKAETRFIADLTGAVVDPDVLAGEIMTYAEFNGLHVPVTKEDISEIRKLWEESYSKENPGITGHLQLLGFQGKSSIIRPDHCIGHSVFLYPHEARIEGSSELAAGLIEVMSEKNFVAIARAVPRANASMNLVALLPQPELLDEETGELLLSPGFHMMRLPFADDIRDLTFPNSNVAHVMKSHEAQEKIRLTQVEEAKRIITVMTEPNWDPEMLDNPSLRACFTTLENLALGLTAHENESILVDIVNPDSEKVAVADEMSKNWLASMGLDSTESISTGARPAVKRIAPKDPGYEWTEDEVRQLIAADQLRQLKVAELQSVVRRFDSLKHLSGKGTKTDLLEKITKNFK